MTLTQTRDRFNAPDWHPSSHPAMPEPVSHGRKPTTYACAFCHRAEGQGGAENANISGLDKAYITQQLEDMRAHKRQSAHDQRPSMVLKHQLTDTITDEEIAVSAAYFASLPARSWLKVVETDTVPRSGVYNNFFLIRMPGSNTEPLGERIIEVPDDADRFESRDTRTTFTTYVPRGSLERGQALATAGCLSCHGEGLKGGSGPRLAGQFATYLIRQLHDFQSGKRKGTQADQMAGVVEKLSVTDMIALAAYAASLSP
jgi:cytochrome c553